ncbi:MAG: succinate dehydrogenase assembly factor 2 [Lamprocystis purpurea]|uniref:FAD assembly factor SdhE n=1 Tax=Lamprocystis purpurea TaxID=61598 RepID=UPI0003A9A6E6|nr:succinate dehydrogenase assembly factor 2 [Lamprocystis purpurea]MBV5274931.1 succinate dehydrogenase assembly factor 2 [Lamprocystis purpurea]
MRQPDPVTDEELRRLRWQCRRGMLELDHLLSGFLDRGYRDLDASGRTEFLALLDNQDQELSDWFMSRSIPDDPVVRDLVRHIVAVVTPRRT